MRNLNKNLKSKNHKCDKIYPEIFAFKSNFSSTLMFRKKKSNCNNKLKIIIINNLREI